MKMPQMKNARRLSIILFAFFCLAANDLSAQDTEAKKLIIGTRTVPPFVITDADGTREGVSVELWKAIAEKLDVEYEFRDFPLGELLTRVESGELDAVVAALSVTAEREEKMDFSHPFLTSGLGVAVRKNDRSLTGSIWKIVVWPLIIVFAVIVVLLIVAGNVIWIVERKRNAENFGGNTLAGIGQGIWWAAATMTTVGYGDVSPRTFLGRTVAVIWMLVGIVIISLFTAFVASKFTTAQLTPTIRTTSDLVRFKIGAIGDTSGLEFLQRNGIQSRVYEDSQAALEALKAKQVEAVVYDRPSLRHLVMESYPGATVLPTILEEETYAIAFPAGSELRESVNRKMLVYLNSESWKKVKLRYLGQD